MAERQLMYKVINQVGNIPITIWIVSKHISFGYNRVFSPLMAKFKYIRFSSTISKYQGMLRPPLVMVVKKYNCEDCRESECLKLLCVQMTWLMKELMWPFGTKLQDCATIGQQFGGMIPLQCLSVIQLSEIGDPTSKANIKAVNILWLIWFYENSRAYLSKHFSLQWWCRNVCWLCG